MLSRLIKKLVIISILFLTLIIISDITFAKKKKDKPMPVETDLPKAAETVTDTTDIHYTGKYCAECHEKRPKKGGDKFLKFGGDFSQLCKCHGYEPGNYIHPVDISLSEEKKTKIPSDLPLQDGKLSCTTCHDIYLQCLDNPFLKRQNRRFLRGAPYAHRTDICFRCHDEKKYKMLDPHEQINENGEIVMEKCLYCHVEKPDIEYAFFKTTTKILGKEVKLIGNLEVLCQRCHGALERHPANAKHLLKPTAKTLALMKETEKQLGIILPLNYEEEITCVTCHNPHEKGVIPENNPASIGADREKHLRLPAKVQQELCLACHDVREI